MSDPPIVKPCTARAALLVPITALMVAVLAACSAATGGGNTPSESVEELIESAVGPPDCDRLTDAYEAWNWAPTGTAADYYSYESMQLRHDEGEAFAEAIDDLDLPTTPLRRAVAVYIDVVGRMVTDYETGDEPETGPVERALIDVVEEYDEVVRESCG